MRKVFQWLIVFASTALAFNAESQGMIYLPGAFPYISNVTNAVEGNVLFGANVWLAQSFQTGTTANGYVTKAILLGASGRPGSSVPSGIVATLYSDSGGVPGIDLGDLGSNIALLPGTTYWIVLANPVSTTTAFDQWAYSSDVNYFASDNWLLGTGYVSSDSGSSWSPYNTDSSFQMGIEATPVPEPSYYALFAAGAALMLLFGKIKRTQTRCGH
jgi:hypothetical protein